MKKLLLKITVFLFKKIYKGELKSKLQNQLFDEIKETYQTVIKDEFDIKKEIIQVKKGYVKYHILYIWRNGKKIKIQISRHFEKKIKEIEI